MHSTKKVFIGYAKEDKAYADTLKKHLNLLERQELIRVWEESLIMPGEIRQAKIDLELDSADIVLMLFSADLIAQEFIWSKAMKAILEKTKNGTVQLIPTIIRPCSFSDTPFAEYETVPEQERPISNWSNADDAWKLVVDKIKNSILPMKDPHQLVGIKTSSIPKPTRLKVLMLTSNPFQTAELNLKEEHSRIAEKLQGKPDHFTLIYKKAVDDEEFKQFTETEKPHILHFSGHGESEDSEGIIVQNENKNGSAMISNDALDVLFEYLVKVKKIGIQAVVLNACYSIEQAKVIAKYVPYVIGTTADIGDSKAIAFSAGFYFELAASISDYQMAYESGKTQAVMKGAKKSNFVLYKDGVKFEA